MKTNELNDRKLKVASGLAMLVIAWLCWNGSVSSQAQSAPANQSPQLQEIVKLTQAKMSDDVILAYIKNSGASYNLSADDILYLNTQGVSQPVISALLQAKGSAPAPAPVPAAPPVQASAPTPVAAAAPAVPVMPASPAPAVSPYPGGQVSPYPTPYTPPPPVVTTPPPADATVNLAYFQSQMSPYGTWVDVPGQGLCFVPSVQNTVPDWRPYFNDGRWLYTDDGWTWQSDYPWGEYAFHYGRWFRDARYGWTWVPGYNWGPGWVAWRQAEGEGYCGWAPLPPGATFDPAIGVMWNGRLAVDADFGLGPDAYVFIPFDHFWAHDYVAFRAPFGRVDFLFRGSVLANHWGFVGGRFVFDGIGRERIGLLTHHDVIAVSFGFRDARIAHSREFEHARIEDFHGSHDFHAGGFDRGRDDHGRDDHGHGF